MRGGYTGNFAAKALRIYLPPPVISCRLRTQDVGQGCTRRGACIGLLPPAGGPHLEIAVFAGNRPRTPLADDPNRAARTERAGR